MKPTSLAAVMLAAALAVPATAHAFCGFYVAGGDQQMFNDATQVVLMRKGTRTVLSMQNNYQGPPQDFAMIVPVPVVLHEGDVKTLPKDVFADVERMGAPRLVEYWERDPCAPAYAPEEYAMAPQASGGFGRISRAKGDDLGVTVEAQFVVGEYQIVILSAKDSTGLDTWLHRESYKIPDGAEPLLRPYVESGSKFFVAKVDPKKVKFENGRAALSPLRFHYDAEQFTLPIRLGLANSSGTQDLIVNILAPNQRYEVANYPNERIPTNLDVKETVRDKFGSFYAALFDATLAQHPGAVITEYAWQASTCDPCPGATLDYHDFLALGADVIEGGSPKTTTGPHRYPRGVVRTEFVLTRLHARYGKSLKDDLVFKAAEPIVGGREIRDADGKLDQTAHAAPMNNFQGRYAIRHAWTGPITCQNPQRGVWGGPPGGGQIATQPALGLAFAPRGQIQLASALATDVPSTGAAVSAAIPPPPPPKPTTTWAPATPTSRGCGCRTSDPAGLALIGLFAICRPGRRRRRLKQ